MEVELRVQLSRWRLTSASRSHLTRKVCAHAHARARIGTLRQRQVTRSRRAERSCCVPPLREVGVSRTHVRAHLPFWDRWRAPVLAPARRSIVPQVHFRRFLTLPRFVPARPAPLCCSPRLLLIHSASRVRSIRRSLTPFFFLRLWVIFYDWLVSPSPSTPILSVAPALPPPPYRVYCAP